MTKANAIIREELNLSESRSLHIKNRATLDEKASDSPTKRGAEEPLPQRLLSLRFRSDKSIFALIVAGGLNEIAAPRRKEKCILREV